MGGRATINATLLERNRDRYTYYRDKELLAELNRLTGFEQIPIEKLVCYGKGTNQALSPSGDYYAAMVPVDKNICDIKDESDQEAS